MLEGQRTRHITDKDAKNKTTEELTCKECFYYENPDGDIEPCKTRFGNNVKYICLSFRHIVLLFIFLFLIDAVAFADTRVYDKDQNLKYHIRNGKVYDKDLNLKYHIRGDKVYDKNQNRVYDMKEGGKRHDK